MAVFRLSTVVGCHQILVLEAGKVCSMAGNIDKADLHSFQVIERGSHHELVELGGKYAEMWRIQNVEDDDHGGEQRGDKE